MYPLWWSLREEPLWKRLKGKRVFHELWPLDELEIPTKAELHVTYKVLILDTETTGFSASDEVVEIATIRARVSEEGYVVDFEGKVQQQCPIVDFHPKASAANGLTKAVLYGKAFDIPEIEADMQWADVIIAHNAQFDRVQMSKVVSEDVMENTVWACSINDIDWRGYGATGQSLEALCQNHGFYYEAHRALIDCTALLTLLSFDGGEDKTYLGHLVAHAVTPDDLIVVIPNRYRKDCVDAVRSMGFNYNGKIN